MIHAQKVALENTTRQRMFEIRYRELDYYTGCARNLGNQAALISGMAYSGIRYHYLLERQQGYKLTEQDSLEEVMFITLLALTLGCRRAALPRRTSCSAPRSLLALRSVVCSSSAIGSGIWPPASKHSHGPCCGAPTDSA